MHNTKAMGLIDRIENIAKLSTTECLSNAGSGSLVSVANQISDTSGNIAACRLSQARRYSDTNLQDKQIAETLFDKYGGFNTFQRITQAADAAMYRVKRSGKNGYCFYVSEMEAAASN